MSTKLNREQRRLRAQIAAHVRWAREPDRSAATLPARRAFDQKFRPEVDPHNVLSTAERERRAESARRAHYHRMQLASSKATRPDTVRLRNTEGLGLGAPCLTESEGPTSRNPGQRCSDVGVSVEIGLKVDLIAEPARASSRVSNDPMSITGARVGLVRGPRPYLPS